MTGINFKTLADMRIELVAHTAVKAENEALKYLEHADSFPVSAARVSHGREDKTGDDPEKDLKLMRFLAEHKHFSPFEHQSATFLVEAPLYVAREWMRHRTGQFNEISMRYTSDPSDTYYIPGTFRAQAAKNKQASEGEVESQDEAAQYYKDSLEFAKRSYDALLTLGVARELARGVLPTCMVTRFYCTFNLRNWAHWYKLRIDPGAQLEIRHYANEIDRQLEALWPTAWKVLRDA